jgi:hypothetical protein
VILNCTPNQDYLQISTKAAGLGMNHGEERRGTSRIFKKLPSLHSSVPPW